VTGEKSEGERFPGAVHTYSIEAMMQDRKALQAGTSHFLGQNFARAQDILFLDKNGERVHAWTTSWGVSTRLVGGLVMTHSDDDGLVCPPRLAPAHIVILPITFKADDPQAVMDYCQSLADELGGQRFADEPVRVHIDSRDMRGGDKQWEWIKKGVPIRIEVGPRDMAGESVFMARRDLSAKEKQSLPRNEFIAKAADLLEEIQRKLYDRALKLRQDHTRTIDSKEEFYEFFTPRNAGHPEIHGGFAWAHWCGDEAVAQRIQKELGVTLRCIPFDQGEGAGRCIFTGQPSPQRVVWAKAY